jgi:hypothetical protein
MGVENNTTLADIRRLTGPQGGGKTVTATSLVVDDCYAKLNKIINTKTGEVRKARSLNTDEIKILSTKYSVKYSPLKHIRVFSRDEKHSRIIEKENDWVIDSPVRVFSNYNFYGIRYRYINDEDIIENVNTDIISDGWIILDESVLTEKRDTMTAVGKIVAWFGAQARRRHLHMVVIAQEANMLQTRFNLFATTTVECTYDPDTYRVYLNVNRGSPFMESTDFYVPPYWKFYKHDEIVKVPQHRVDKVLYDIKNPIMKRN